MQMLPLEVLALIASFTEIAQVNTLALTSRQLLAITDRSRYSSPVITSSKGFATLCSIFNTRQSTAAHCRRLIFDWDESKIEQFTPLGSLLRVVARALENTTRLKTFVFHTLPPASFVEFLANFHTQLATVSTLEYGQVGVPFDFGRMDRHDLLSTLFVPLTKINDVQFRCQVPRCYLRAVMLVLGNGTSPLIDCVTLAVPNVDFGVIQEMTLQDKDLSRETSCITNVSITGPFAADPYAPVRIRCISYHTIRCFFFS